MTSSVVFSRINRQFQLAIFFILFLSSCTTSLQQKSDGRPHWLEEPSLKNHITVIGSASPQKIGGKEGQRRVALSKARAELAKAVRVQIYDELNIIKTERNGQVGNEIQHRTQIKSLEILRLNKAFVKDQWIDPVSHELFYWYVTPASE